MYSFEEYTLTVYGTPKEYHTDVPKHRFVAYLKEIPEATLHEYGSTQEQAIKNLRKQFSALKEDCKRQGINLPEPICKDLSKFSGRIVLRMPSWLHYNILLMAREEELSINSYIVNHLIKETTIQSVSEKIQEAQMQCLHELKYEIETKQSASKISKSKLIIKKLQTPQYNLYYN